MDAIDELVDALAPTGVLRVMINLGNPVLTNGTPDDPGGVSVAIAREAAARLGVPVELRCVDAARRSLAALVEGDADLAFLAIEPARAEQIVFSPSYVTIEGVYATGAGSDLVGADDVDRPGVTIGVKEGSAYDLFLTRTIRHAVIVRGTDGTDVYLSDHLDVAAGVRQPVTAFVGDGSRHRLLEPAFMQIHQAVGIARGRGVAAEAFVSTLVLDLLRSGFVARELARSGQDPALAVDPG